MGRNHSWTALAAMVGLLTMDDPSQAYRRRTMKNSPSKNSKARKKVRKARQKSQRRNRK